MTTILVHQYSSVSMEEEFQHVQRWSVDKKLQINVSKTKEFKLYLDVNVSVVLLYHNPCDLLNRSQLLNFLEFISLQPFSLSHMSSTFLHS